MADLDARDPRFEGLIDAGAELRTLHSGMGFTEGPVYVADGDYLLWSDIPNSRIMRWSESDGVSVFRDGSNNTNGNTLDRQGRLVSCEHSGRRVSRTEPSGEVVTLADAYRGGRLNSPNDVAVRSDGMIFFTDPPYGLSQDEYHNRIGMEQNAHYVFRLDPESGTLTAIADDFEMPNGIAFSPDEKLLYVSDTGPSSHIRAFDIAPDGTLSNGRVFAVVDPRGPDGFRIDTAGNIWTSAGDGIHVFDPSGTLLGRLLCPEQPSNCTFGGPDKRTLFITARTSLFAIDVNATGAQTP